MKANIGVVVKFPSSLVDKEKEIERLKSPSVSGIDLAVMFSGLTTAKGWDLIASGNSKLGWAWVQLDSSQLESWAQIKALDWPRAYVLLGLSRPTTPEVFRFTGKLPC